jgi:hypothetical protein
MIKTHDDWIDPKLAGVEFELVGQDGNAMMLIGYTRGVLRKAGNSPEVLTAFSDEVTSGDYDHVIQTCMAYGGDLS